jgi:hypothetical protein
VTRFPHLNKYAVRRHQNDLKTVVNFSAWSSLNNVRGFKSPELMGILETAGVKAKSFFSLEKIEPSHSGVALASRI